MGALDWLILLLVAAAFVAAVIRSVRHRGSCGGNCTSCGKNCPSRKESGKRK